MKKCLMCGREIDSNDSYCPHCNAQLTGSNGFSPHMTFGTPVSVRSWILRFLLTFIPLIGQIVYIVMLFMWMHDENAEETAQNWAKSQLILIGIGFVLCTIIVVTAVLLGKSPLQYLAQQ